MHLPREGCPTPPRRARGAAPPSFPRLWPTTGHAFSRFALPGLHITGRNLPATFCGVAAGLFRGKEVTFCTVRALPFAADHLSPAEKQSYWSDKYVALASTPCWRLGTALVIGPRPRSPIRTQLNCLRRSPMSISNSQRAASSKQEKQSNSDPSLCFAASLSHAFIFILLYPLFNPLINASHPHLQLSSSRIRFARHSTWQPKVSCSSSVSLYYIPDFECMQ